MRERSFYDTHSRRRSSPYRHFRQETQRSGSSRLEPDRLRVVSPVRRTDHEDNRSDHRRRSNNVDFAPYTDGAASSKFHWDNLLEAKQLEKATSSSSGFVYRISGSGSGPMDPTGPLRSYGGLVLPLKENEVVHLPPMHCEHQQRHQQVGYGFSVSQPNAFSLTPSPPPSHFGGKLGLLRSVGIGTDGNFEHVHVQTPKPNSVEVSNNNMHCSIMNRVLNYSEVQRSERSDGIPCSNNGGFMSSEFQRPSIVDSIVEKIDGALGNIDSLRKGTPWKEKEVKDEEQHFVEPLCCSRHVVPEYGREDGYRDSEEGWSLRGYEKNAYTYSDYQGNCKVLPVLDHDQYVYKHGGVLDDKITKTEVEMFDLGYGHGGKAFENQIWNAFHAASPHCHKLAQKSRYSPEPEERTPRKKEMIIRESTKKRLRDASGRIIHLPSSLGSCHRNVHARLGPRVLAEEPCEGVKHIKKKELKRDLCEFSRSVPCSDPLESEVKETAKHSKRSKTEPPEDSKEFKQLVQNAFFKFVKLLNENPSQRRKYIDKGGVDTLRCTLCGSKSKEFANTHSLAMHAFNSTKARHRAEHLGFHKALCVLLGWRDTPASDGLWVRQALPASEALNLKNDLIIWPPAVLIHNSSVANGNPDKRVIISIEGLEAILKGMGFGGGKTKVFLGKPANYSVLVVTFNATFSGLQEAERLHKFYSDMHRGRAEFQQIDDEGTQGLPENEESVLYGYLGNAGDFDKLDFESKKHSVVKSKKEIQAIVDNTLKAS